MNKVSECYDFDSLFPERFRWEEVDNILLASVACDIRFCIEKDIAIGEKDFLPGLRCALRIISRYANT